MHHVAHPSKTVRYKAASGTVVSVQPTVELRFLKCLHGVVGRSVLFSPSLASVRLVDAREDPGPKDSLVQFMFSDGLRLY